MKPKAFFRKHGSTILTVLTIAGTIGAVISAVKAKPKYDKLVEERTKEREDNKEEFTKKDKAECLVKAYGVTAAITAVTAGCAVGAKILDAKEMAKRSAESAALLAMSEKGKKMYQEIAESKLTPKQAAEVRDEIAKRKTEELFGNLREGEIDDIIEDVDTCEGPAPGRQLIAETWGGTIFADDPVKFEKRFNDFNVLYLGHDHDYVPVTDWYDHMKINVGRNKAAQYGGWGYDVKKIEFSWVPFPISSGPYKGRIVWAMQFKEDSEPLDIDR